MATKNHIVAPRKEITSDVLAKRMQESGMMLFKERSGFPLSQAQRNLEGRTHYVDDSTLKAFDAKVHTCEVLDDGLILGIVESVKMDADSARIYRPVFFDLFGNTVIRPELEDSFASQKQANASFWAMANDVDAVQSTLEGIKEKQKYLQSEIDKLDELMEQIKA